MRKKGREGEMEKEREKERGKERKGREGRKKCE